MHLLQRFLILVTSLACVTDAGFAQEPLQRENPYDFRNHIRDTSEWTLANQHRVQLKMVGKNTVIEDGRGKLLLEVKAPDYLNQVCQDPKGGCLVFAIWNTKDGRGSDYTALVLIRAVESGLKVSRVFESGDHAVSKDRWWVSELGAVSESGERILAKFGEMLGGSGSVTYRWQTWKVSPPTRLGIGLQISNGQTEDKPGEQGADGNTH